MNRIDFEVAVGEAAQDAVWSTPHPLTYRLADDDPLRAQYLSEYHQMVGRQVLAAVMRLAAGNACCHSRRSEFVF
ncbi:hypothetical protein [Mycolicibacterium phlei]